MVRVRSPTIRIGDKVTLRKFRPPLCSDWVVEEINNHTGKAKCRGTIFSYELIMEHPIPKLSTCVDDFLRGRKRAVESYRAEFLAVDAFEHHKSSIRVDRTKDRCQLAATVFSLGEDGSTWVADSSERVVKVHNGRS